MKPTSKESDHHLGVLQPKGFPGLPPGWVSEWETFPSSDGKVRLFGVSHHPEGKAWTGHRALLIVHGMGEHCGRYLHFPHYLRNSVDVFYAYDHRGHGRSEGLRGYADRFDVFAEDLKLVIRNLDERLMSRFGKSEIHVFAHSFGGLVALYTLFSDSRLPVQSLSLSAPLLGIKVAVPVVKKWAGIALSRVWGSIQMVNEIDPKDISHDPQVISAYVADRLVHNKITPRLFTEMTTAMNQVCKRESGLEYPLLMMIPEEDKITDSEASLRFFRALKQRDKLLKTYPGFYHESFNEIEKTKAFEDLETWLNQHRKPN